MKLKFWVRTALQNYGVMLLVICVYFLVISLQNREQGLALLPLYLLTIGNVFLISMGLTVFKFHLNLALSFGSTRNEAILGILVYNLLPALVNTGLVAVSSLLMKENALIAPGEAALLTLGIGLATAAVGNLLGTLYARFGRIATVVFFLSCLLVGAAFGLLTTAVLGTSLDALIDRLGRGGLIVCIGLILYGISFIPASRTVWRYTVRI